MASGIVAAITMLAGAVGGDAPELICQFDDRGVAHSAAITIAPYPVAGATVETVVAELTDQAKPFPARAYGQIGWFDYAWRSRVGLGPDGAIASICVNVNYSVYYPSINDPEMAKCFGHLAQKVERHEMEHLEITEATISTALHEVIGMAPDQAKRRLARLDRDINKANAHFHRTPAGAVMGPADFPADSCSG